jgi:hypothetical protein
MPAMTTHRSAGAHAIRVLAVGLGTSLLLIACASNGVAPSDAAEPSVAPPASTAEVPASDAGPPGAEASVQPDEDAPDAALGATITVGAETWEFELSSVYPGGCWEDANGIDTGGSVDGEIMGVSFAATNLRPDGGELVVTNDATGERWMARADREGMTTYHLLPDGSSQIDSITIEGGRITGTATFIEMDAAADAIMANAPLACLPDRNLRHPMPGIASSTAGQLEGPSHRFRGNPRCTTPGS